MLCTGQTLLHGIYINYSILFLVQLDEILLLNPFIDEKRRQSEAK